MDRVRAALVTGHTDRARERRPRLRRRWLRDRRIRTKLGLILLLPVLAIVALTGVSVASAAKRAADAGQARQLVAAGGAAARLAAQLQRERAAAALVFAESNSVSAVAGYRQQGEATDRLVAAFEAGLDGIGLPDNLRPLLVRVRDDLAGLAALRQKVAAAPDAVLSVVAFRYRAVIADLIGYRQALGQVGVSSSTANELRAAAALSQGIESLGQLQVAAVRVLAAGRLTPAGQQEIVAADTGVTEALQTFTDLSPPDWPAVLNSRIGGGPQILRAERLQGVVTRAQPGTGLELDTDARGWSTAMGARLDVMHAVEADLDGRLLAAVTTERDAERRTIVTASAVVATLLAIVVTRAVQPAAVAPPPWPPVSSENAHRTVEPVIYHQLAGDPTRSWFHPTPSTPDGELVGAAAGWPGAARAATPAGLAGPVSTTPGGLPVRQPGQQLIPPAEPASDPPPPPVQRHADRLRQQMSAFQRGLGQAGRRQTYNLPKGNQP
jgi:Nitrate and nitrite sensing